MFLTDISIILPIKKIRLHFYQFECDVYDMQCHIPDLTSLQKKNIKSHYKLAQETKRRLSL